MTMLRWTAFVILAVALVGCGDSTETSDASSTQQEAAQQETAQGNGEEAPTLTKVTHADAMNVVKESDATVTVINFWATWCVPCVEEFPSFVKLDRMLDDRGVDVMFISTDFPNKKPKVVEFLAEHDVTGTSYLKTGNSTKFVNNFNEEWSGAVPATFIYDDKGTLLDFWEGKVSYKQLKQRVTTHLDEA